MFGSSLGLHFPQLSPLSLKVPVAHGVHWSENCVYAHENPGWHGVPSHPPEVASQLALLQTVRVASHGLNVVDSSRVNCTGSPG